MAEAKVENKEVIFQRQDEKGEIWVAPSIRMARPEDAEALLKIYAPYVMDTAITFEYEVPSVEDFRDRITHTLEKYPYLVAVEQEKIVGYAYVSAFKDRKAYDWAVETSIYVALEDKKKGWGKRLYAVIEEILVQQQIQNLNACIACTDREDEHLTNDSVQFHEHLGYRLVGTFQKCGYKFETWYDMVWMEKMIGTHPNCPNEVIPVSQLLSGEEK